MMTPVSLPALPLHGPQKSLEAQLRKLQLQHDDVAEALSQTKALAARRADDAAAAAAVRRPLTANSQQ